ncbi:MAG TPA: hypothetical protein VIS72_02085 [Anaerolineales bacterium]
MEKEKQLKKPRENKTNTKFPISEGIFLGLISASAYFFTYTYERGYAGYFNIPTELITVSLNTTLLFFTIIFGFFGFLFIFLDISTTLLKGLNPIIAKTVLPVFITLFLPLIYIYFFGLIEWSRWMALLIFCLIIAFIQFIFPLLTQRKVRGYINKLAAQLEADRQNVNFPSLLADWFGLNPIIFLLLFIFGYFVASTAGLAEAVKKTDFLVIHSNPEVVVLRIYNDLAIGASFNRTTKELGDEFTFTSIKQDPNIVFELESIGPLTRPDNRQSSSNNLPATTPSPSTPNTIQTTTPIP